MQESHFPPYLHLRKWSFLQSNMHICLHSCFYYCYFNEYFHNYCFLPSRCPESAAEEDISSVALLAPISSKQMHLSLFTISPILPLTTHQRQVINTEEKQFIFIACNHSKHPHGLFVPPRQEGRQSDNTPLVAEVHYFTWAIPLFQHQKLCEVLFLSAKVAREAVSVAAAGAVAHRLQ